MDSRVLRGTLDGENVRATLAAISSNASREALSG